MVAVAVRPFRVDRDVVSTARLTPDEWRRTGGIASPAGRARFVSGRLALRELAADVLGLPPEAVAVAGADHRPPQLVDHPDVGVSIAATGDVGVVAIALAARVGVDIEATDRHPLPAPARWCTAAEQAALVAAPSARARQRLALRLWTAKEARCKAAGTGQPLATLAVLAVEDGLAWLSFVPGHVVALAVAA